MEQLEACRKIMAELEKRGRRATDREMSMALGLSLTTYNRLKRALVRGGYLSVRVVNRRSGTEYLAETKSETKNETKPKIIRMIQEEGERDACAREASPEVLVAWELNRGRPLIEREVLEMACWEAELGTERLVELIELAWDRCTVEHMSMWYIRQIVERHGFQKAAVRETKPVKQRSETKKLRKQKPAAEPIKVATPRDEIKPATAEIPWRKNNVNNGRESASTGNGVWTKVDAGRNPRTFTDGSGAKNLRGVQGVAVQTGQGEISGGRAGHGAALSG